MRRILFVLPFLLFSAPSANAQEMATGMRSSGKIYIVVLVLATIFAGIIAFLVYLERRIKQMERDARQGL